MPRLAFTHRCLSLPHAIDTASTGTLGFEILCPRIDPGMRGLGHSGNERDGRRRIFLLLQGTFFRSLGQFGIQLSPDQHRESCPVQPHH